MGRRNKGGGAPSRLPTGICAHATFAPHEMQVHPPASVHTTLGSARLVTKFSTSGRELERGRWVVDWSSVQNLVVFKNSSLERDHRYAWAVVVVGALQPNLGKKRQQELLELLKVWPP